MVKNWDLKKKRIETAIIQISSSLHAEAIVVPLTLIGLLSIVLSADPILV